MTAYNYSQQQFNDLRAQREQVAQRLQAASDAYTRSRELLIAPLTAWEKDSSAKTARAQSPAANPATSQNETAASSGKETPPVENSVKKCDGPVTAVRVMTFHKPPVAVYLRSCYSLQ